MTTLRILTTAFISLAIACAGPGAGGGAPPGDAIDTLPSWQLEDIQPLSPRTGQTYGLAAFTDHIVVVTLVAGF